MRAIRTAFSALMTLVIGQTSLARAAEDPASAVSAVSGSFGMTLAVVLGHSTGQVTGSETAPSHAARLQAVRALSKDLLPDEVQALYGFLNRKSGEDPASAQASSAERNALKNDVVNALKMQTVMPADLPARLIAMFNDPAHDPVWRDYCIQHLGSVYAGITPLALQEQARQTLWTATSEKQGSIPGTALIALANLAGQPGFEKARIAATALALVRLPDYGEPAKITAFQICAKLDEQAVLPDARQQMTNGSVLIRVSALACVGILGDQSDLAALRQMESSSDSRLRTAAQAAIKRVIEKR
jgi:HEAT repeat protein